MVTSNSIAGKLARKYPHIYSRDSKLTSHDSKSTRAFLRHTFKHELDDKIIHLYTVRHVGTIEEYTVLNDYIQNDFDKGHVIHVEGVQGSPPNVSKSLKDLYSLLARALDAVMQERPKVPHEIHDAKFSELSFASKVFLKVFANLMNALVKLLNEQSHEDLKKNFKKALDDDERPNDLIFGFMTNLLGGIREDIAVSAAVNTLDNVSMIWGAAHTPSFARKFQVSGFKYVDTISLMS